jgi:multidrug efflux pump subunit AcrB
MNVSTWSIKNPVPALMLFVLLTFAGVISFKAMKIQQFPDVEMPIVIVSAALPGAAPAQLETEVARKLEDAIASVQGLKHTTTKVQDGMVTLTNEFQLEKPIQEAIDDVRSAVAKVRNDLPSDLNEPVVNKLDMAAQPVLAFTIRSVPRASGQAPSMDTEALSWFVDNEVSKALLSVRGVGSVKRVGGVTREVVVALDPLKLQSFGATAADVSRQLRMVQSESAGGKVDLGGSEQPMRTIVTTKTAADIGQLPIALSSGQRIRLDQLGKVEDTYAEPRAAAFLNGQPVVGFEVSRSRGESEVTVGAGVMKKLAALKEAHPDIELTEAFNFVDPVQEEYDGSLALLYEGAVLAVLVVWLFLRDWRATFVSAVALPLSVVPAFIGMHYLGFSINVVTLLALSLVVGVLVDDAIVEVENIVRHLRMGKSPLKAAMEAADEIGMAVIATTFTLIAVFLPTAFMSGIVGRFFKQFGWTAALAVFASLAVARLLTPMMAAYMLKADSGKVHTDPGWMRWYLGLAAWCIRHRWSTLLMSILFFFGSIALVPLLPTAFIPSDDNSQTQVYLELQPGATLAQTVGISEQVRSAVAKVPHVKSIYTTVGGGSAGADPFASSGAAESRRATLTILLDPRGERPRKQVIENQIRGAIEPVAGMRSKVGLGGSGEKYILVLTGDDAKALQDAAVAVEKDLRTIPGLGSVASSASLIRAELAIRPDLVKAADMGVTTAAIGETLRIATTGDYDAALPKLNLAQRQIPIVVKLDEAARKDMGVLERLYVPSPKGPVMLGQVATLELTGGPAVIDRYDRARNVTFEIELSGLPLGEVTEQVDKLPAIKNLPAGVKKIEVGDAEMMGELFASFGLAMLTGVLCIYLVLVLLFKDFLLPATLLFALLVAPGGAFVALLITGKALSMPSFIGLIMLMGIAIKNSILLVDYAVIARRGHDGSDGNPVVEPMSRFDALVDACHKRARPIIMTSIAMGAGMLPIALSLGAADSSFRAPMAVAVIGGLITSTILSLVVIPPVFTLFDDLEHLIKRGFDRLRGKSA